MKPFGAVAAAAVGGDNGVVARRPTVETIAAVPHTAIHTRKKFPFR